MVDCALVDTTKITQEQRVKIVEYVQMQKHISAAQLGVTSTYLWMIRKGVRRVTDDLLCKALQYISPEELAKLLGELPEPGAATVNDVVKVVRRAVYDAQFRELLISMLEKHLGDYIRSAGRKYVVSEADLEEFRKALVAEGRAKDTIYRNLRYLQVALSRLNWILSPEGVRELIGEMLAEGELSAARHTAKALKKFIRTVLRERDPYLAALIYHAVPAKATRQQANNKTKPPTLEQLKQIASLIESAEAKFYFCLLAECGLRPGEPFMLRMADVDFSKTAIIDGKPVRIGVLYIGRLEETKRAFVAFLRPELAEWAESVYLPRREWLIKSLALEGTEMAQKLLPFDRDRLRGEIKHAAKQVLGRDFELYELRKFFASWLISQGVPEVIIDTLQGRAPHRDYRVLVEHYWSPTHETLAKWYLQHAPRICA